MTIRLDTATEQEREDPWYVDGARWAGDHGPLVLLQIPGTICIAIAAAWLGISGCEDGFANSEWWRSQPAILLWIGILVNAIGTFLSEKQRPRISVLEEQLRQARAAVQEAQQQSFDAGQGYIDVLEQQLTAIASQVLGFGNTERISLYSHQGDRFTLLGRYSRNPEFRKPGRAHYPEHEGCIGQAWANGHSIVEELPDAESDPHSYQKAAHEISNMPIRTSQKLRMKSRSLAAFSIESAQETPIGVIVFESMRTDVLDFERLEELVKGSEGRRLAAFVEKTRPFEAAQSVAKKKGF